MASNSRQPPCSIDFVLAGSSRIGPLRRFWSFLRTSSTGPVSADALSFLDQSARTALVRRSRFTSEHCVDTPDSEVASSEAEARAALRWILLAADNPDMRLHDIETLDNHGFRIRFTPMASPYGSVDFILEVIRIFGGNVVRVLLE